MRAACNLNRFLLSLLPLLLIIGCDKTPPTSEQTTIEQLPHYQSDRQLLVYAYQQTGKQNTSTEIIPLPDSLPIDPAQSALGKKLFFDPRLSADNSVACVSCHLFSLAGADDKPVSIGIHQRKGELNSPPVFNAVFNIAQFWDGRAKDLAEQAEGPILNPVEMGMPDWQTLIQKLKQTPDYPQAFQKVFPQQGITRHTITYAIAQFERTLISPNSRFDRYLKGEVDALTEFEKQGYQLFKQRGCIACHNGINIGGNLFQKAGVFDPLVQTDKDTKPWIGRFAVTQDPADKYYIKVPTLRNIELTAPYYHDGSVATLEKAINLMAERQLGIQLSPTETQQLLAFLKTLTGQYQGKMLNAH